jgi:hypothetical protein
MCSPTILAPSDQKQLIHGERYMKTLAQQQFKLLYGLEKAYRFSIYKSVYFRGCSGYMKTLASLQLVSSFIGGKQLTGFQVLGVKVFAAVLATYISSI